MKRYGDVASDIKIAIHQILDDPAFIENWPVISLLPNVPFDGEVEIERKLIRNLNLSIGKSISKRPMPKGILTNSDLKTTDDGFYCWVKIFYGDGIVPKKLGKIFYHIQDTSHEILLEIVIQFPLLQSKFIYQQIDPLFPCFSVSPDPSPLENIYGMNPLVAIIDFEWINYVRSPNADKGTKPEQISEYAILVEGELYHSDYLQVDCDLVKKIHRKLLEKQGTTIETLIERHQEGSTMEEEFQEHIHPLLKRSRQEKRPLLFLYFGKEDGVILQQLFRPDECEEIHFVDFMAQYHISQLGQEAILHGLDVEFLHTFDPAMDVKALEVIARVFHDVNTVEDSLNLQNAILVEKMLQNTNQPQRLQRYQQLFLAHDKTNALFTKALDIVQEFQTEMALEWETQEARTERAEN